MSKRGILRANAAVLSAAAIIFVGLQLLNRIPRSDGWGHLSSFACPQSSVMVHFESPNVTFPARAFDLAWMAQT